MARRRTNLCEPPEQTIANSVARLVRVARRAVVDDHRNKTCSPKERDMIASVYLRRAHDIVNGDD